MNGSETIEAPAAPAETREEFAQRVVSSPGEYHRYPVHVPEVQLTVPQMREMWERQHGPSVLVGHHTKRRIHLDGSEQVHDGYQGLGLLVANRMDHRQAAQNRFDFHPILRN
jgi:hypothetical protein